MLYEIQEDNGKFKHFFNKKTGLKFKKAFTSTEREAVELFAERYLSHCCFSCKERGWVYKTRGSGGLCGGGARHGKGNRGSQRYGKPASGTILRCPECRTTHQIQYDRGHVVLNLHLEE